MGEPATVWKILLCFALGASSCSFITDTGEETGEGVDLAATDDDFDDDSDDSSDDDSEDGAGADDEDGAGDGSGDDESIAPTVPDLENPQWERLPLDLVLIADYATEEGGVSPIALASRSGSSDLYVANRGGTINRIEVTFTQGAGLERIRTSTRTVLDISESITTNGEGGLLGIAFSTDGRFLYVSYTATNGDSVVDEYDIDRRTEADVETRRELLRVDQPFSNHNGGHLAFGQDGFLYVGLGDGGSAGDPEGNGQDPSTLLGSIVRIDTVPDGNDPYTIPSGNPFAFEGDGAPEVFLWGMRNPWRFSFDLVTGDLWIGDVGQDSFEEINFLPAATGNGVGTNLGWNGVEGFEVIGTEPDEHTLPIFAYPTTDEDCSVTGGYVYRGILHPILDGVYVFGDYCSGTIWGLQTSDEGAVARELLISVSEEQEQRLGENELVSFGEGHDGELYVLSSAGQIYRLEPPEAG